jgi:glycerate 2-kinase
MNILISPNAFKGSLDAAFAAEAIERGLEKSLLKCKTKCFPIADGGDGTAEIITNVLKGKFVKQKVKDPLGREISAQFGVITGDNPAAVIDIATASGIRLLSKGELNPLKATTFGTGQLISKALDLGITKIILGVGGSATVDGGAGILQALGAQFIDENGKLVNPQPKNFTKIRDINLDQLEERLSNIEIIVLCDVKNPLLGRNGAASVFAPQKGAGMEEVQLLETALSHFNNLILEKKGKNLSQLEYGGAAGGTSAGLYAFADGKLVSGIDYFLELTSFEKELYGTDLLITGEGSIDNQTLEGKGPAGVARMAKARGISVVGIAGKIPLHIDSKLRDSFDCLFSIQNDCSDLGESIPNTAINLERTSEQIGNLIHLSNIRSGVHLIG